MFELVKKIQELIDAYHGNNEELAKEIKRIVEEWGQQVNAFRMEYIQEQISNEVEAALKDANKVNEVYNQKLKVVIDEGKKQILSNYLKKFEKPADYATQVSNAIEYLKLEGEEITDESAYMYLKDFMEDYDQMKVFKNVIEKLIKRINPTGLTDAEGKTTFPKTFGKLNKIETILNSFNEIESIAENLFIYPREDGQTFIMNGQSYSVPVDSYEQMAGEENIIDFAKIIEEYAKTIPGIGKVTDQTEHEIDEPNEE